MIPRTERPFVWILVGTVALVVTVAWWIPEPVDWSDSFAADDARPYASEVIRAALPELFPEGPVQTVTEPPFVQLRDTTSSSGAYLFVSAQFAPPERETRRLLDYAARGNTVFVAAHEFGGAWADTLRISTRLRRSGLPAVQTTSDSISIWTEALPEDRGVFVREETVPYVFDSLGAGSSTVLGEVQTSDSTAPTYVRRSYGDGTIFLSTTPRVFTNVHALDPETASYVWTALSYIPATADPVWWDAYYKPGRTEAETPLRFVLSTPALRHAYVVLLVGVVLFVLVKARRRQRAIPVIEPPENATVDLVTTLGRLAHRRGDPDTVARRRITYLEASVREQLDVQAEPGTSTWIRRVAARAGVPEEDVAALAETIRAIRGADTITEPQLKMLDRQIQAFREARTR